MMSLESNPLPLKENVFLEPDKKATQMNTADLEVYRSGVKNLLESKTNLEISNGYPEHAAVLYEQFFLHAQKCVKIFCKNLARDTFGMDFVLKGAETAIANGKFIEILIQESQPDASEFVELLKKKNISVYQVSAQDREIKQNFSIMDLDAYRYEPSNDEAKASANMYHPEIAIRIATLFDKLKSKSTVIALA